MIKLSCAPSTLRGTFRTSTILFSQPSEADDIYVHFTDEENETDREEAKTRPRDRSPQRGLPRPPSLLFPGLHPVTSRWRLEIGPQWEYLCRGDWPTVQIGPLLFFLSFFKLWKNCLLNIRQPLSGQGQDSNISLSPQVHALSSSVPGAQRPALAEPDAAVGCWVLREPSGWERAHRWLPRDP